MPAVSPYRAQFTTSCAAAPTVDDKNPAMIDVAVVGPGAIGCAFGGAGILAGRRVVFAARTPFDRLTVNYPDVTVDEAADVITNPVEATEASIVLVATKTYQTEEAAGWFERLVGPETLVVVLQNGVTHMDRVPPLLGGRGQVLPAVVACPAERTSPGRVTVTGKVMLRIPEGPTGRRPVEAFEGSMADIRLERDWALLVCLCGATTRFINSQRAPNYSEDSWLRPSRSAKPKGRNFRTTSLTVYTKV
jgi:hypothetical protein